MKALRPVVRLLLWSGLLSLFAASAAACPVCFQVNQRSRHAYYATTGAMLLLPSAMVSGFVVWYRRQARRLPGEGEGTT